MATISVGLADDQQLVRAGFSLVLGSQDDIDVAWQAQDGKEATELAESHPVDVILMDVQMPTLDGIAATRRIVEAGVRGPQGETTKVVVLTTFDHDNYVLGSVEAGASGFLLKDVDPEELIAAVRTVGESAAVISPKATARLLRQVREGIATGSVGTAHSADSAGTATAAGADSEPLPLELDDPLTPREEEILTLMAQGFSNQEIAQKLFISLPTVKTHVGRVLLKTGSRDRVHAVLFALKHRLVSPDELLQDDGDQPTV